MAVAAGDPVPERAVEGAPDQVRAIMGGVEVRDVDLYIIEVFPVQAARVEELVDRVDRHGTALAGGDGAATLEVLEQPLLEATGAADVVPSIREEEDIDVLGEDPGCAAGAGCERQAKVERGILGWAWIHASINPRKGIRDAGLSFWTAIAAKQIGLGSTHALSPPCGFDRCADEDWNSGKDLRGGRRMGGGDPRILRGRADQLDDRRIGRRSPAPGNRDRPDDLHPEETSEPTFGRRDVCEQRGGNDGAGEDHDEEFGVSD